MTVAGAVIGIYYRWNIIEVAVFAIFIWVILNPLPSKYFSGLAIFLMSLIPLFLIFGKNDMAESVAIYSYYFFFIAFIAMIHELRRMKNQP